MSNRPGRIEIAGKGVGEIGDEEIRQRAMELARMDGRKEAGAHDLANACEELKNPGPASAPEADESEEPVGSWSDAPGSAGRRGVEVLPDDEQTLAEHLVEEGLEEADREQRLAASDEFPPEE
jgi:hypothetical protein